MPRGKRKLGAFNCTIWMPDGSRYQAWTDAEKNLTEAELLATFDDTFGRVLANMRKRLEALPAAPHGADTPGQETK